MKPRMLISHVMGKAYGSFDGYSWFLLKSYGMVPYQEAYYKPDLKYEVGGRGQAIKDLRECFVP